MRREEVLEKARQCVCGDRPEQYGQPEDVFADVARYWGVYLGLELRAADVAAMMVLLKVARADANPCHADNWVDIAGYAACGAEVSEPLLKPADVG